MSAIQPPPAGLTHATVVMPAERRFRTRTDWLESRHSFSFGAHYDPANTHHGLLLACNDDVVAPHSGFASHPHRDTEIVTWVLEGSLTHEDSTGERGVIRPGLAQRMSAGSGVVHSERNDADEPVHFVQMWVAPDETSLDPGYDRSDVRDALAAGGLVTVASGRPEHSDSAAVRIAQRHAALHAVRLRARDRTTLPAAPYLHVFVTRGSVELEGAGVLHRGDAARVTASDGQRLTSTTDGEALVWEMHATVA